MQPTEYGVKFIRAAAAADQPLFLYAAFDSTHVGLYYNASYVGKSRRGEIGSAAMELSIGRSESWLGQWRQQG
jgi:hypothetical protein